MATTIQLLRSDIARQRPDPGVLANGVPMVNLNESEPGLFFSDRTGTLFKVGPVAIGTDVPNTNPEGEPGNAKGETWLDTSGIDPILKVYDGGSWVKCFEDPGGTVTSVGLTFTSLFTVSNSPVTSSGTLTASLQDQVKNTVFSGPDAVDGTPSFRALVDSDIPALSATKITSGQFDSGRIPSLNASKITTGTFSTSRIPNLNASKITSGTLPYTVGGTGVSAAPLDGELLIGNNAGGGWTKTTLTAGANIGIANAGGSITISSSATPTLTSVILDDGAGETLTLEVQNIPPAGSYTLRFPTADGTSGNVMVTDGAGDLSFVSSLSNITSISGLTGLYAVGALTIYAGGAANNIILEPTGGGLVQIGNNAPTSPGLKDNVAVLETRVSDDSDYAEHAAAIFQSAKAYTVGVGASQLPAGTVGQIARVIDASAPSVGSTVSGGGAAAALCWYNGSNWTVIGV
jgi:hypothetical protein